MAILVSEVWLVFCPHVTVTVSGCMECEFSDPALGVVQMSGNGFVW